MPRPRTHDDRTGRVFPDHLRKKTKRRACARHFRERSNTTEGQKYEGRGKLITQDSVLNNTRGAEEQDSTVRVGVVDPSGADTLTQRRHANATRGPHPRLMNSATMLSVPHTHLHCARAGSSSLSLRASTAQERPSEAAA